MIVPGGRFRESYYWDSWSIIRGLLVCDMIVTAQYVVDNLLDDISNFGFIPNGGRIYYLDRSQPPLLSEMILSYIDKVGYDSPNGTAMLEKAFPLLQTEYEWWMNSTNGHTVTFPNGMVLNRYFSAESTPRPESYAEDYETAEDAEKFSNPRSNSSLYQNIRSGAETGWDFSSRWIGGQQPKSNLTLINTTEIIPVELNAYLYRYEQNMQLFASYLNLAPSVINFYRLASQNRYDAIDGILWKSQASGTGIWVDFNLTCNASQEINEDTLSLSQWIPMWAGL
jgi:alpha,alpha-trehalase